MAICKSLLVGWRAPRWGSRASGVSLLLVGWSGLLVGWTLGRMKKKVGRGRAGRCRPAFSAPARSPLAARPSRPSRPIGRKKIPPARPLRPRGCSPSGRIRLSGSFVCRGCSLRSHRVSFPLSPPSLRSCPPFAPFGRCPGAVCAPSLVGVCMPLSLPSLRSGSGGSLLAPLLPAQGRARPWANVARPPSPLSARGGDGAGLCVSLLPVLCAPSPKNMLLWLGHRNAEKTGVPSRPARLRPTSALRPQVWGFLLFSGGWRGRQKPLRSQNRDW